MRPVALLVEDDPELCEVMADALGRRGFDVVTSHHGDEAAARLADELPDLLVTDLMLPGTSGFMLTRLAKERSDGRVAVILVTGNTSAAHRDYALAAGADIFLGKPFPLAALADAAAELCPQVRTPAPRPQPAAAGS